MIKPEEIKRLGELARLEIEAGQEVALARDLDEILGYVAKLDEARVDETAAETAEHLAVNVTRTDDSPHPPGAFTKQLLAAPRQDGRYFKVKKIL